MAVMRLLHKRRLLMVILTTALIFYLLKKKPPRQPRPRVALLQDQPLLNLKNFHLLQSPDACHPDEEVKAVLVITSHAGNVRARMAWRNGIPSKVRI
jgi:hypothetical protein